MIFSEIEEESGKEVATAMLTKLTKLTDVLKAQL